MLAAVLRGVGLAVGLVCLYALVQALTVTARERRGAVALLRACGADGETVGLVLAGAAVAVALPAAIAGRVLEVAVFGPLVARLAAGFALAAALTQPRPGRARRWAACSRSRWSRPRSSRAECCASRSSRDCGRNEVRADAAAIAPEPRAAGRGAARRSLALAAARDAPAPRGPRPAARRSRRRWSTPTATASSSAGPGEPLTRARRAGAKPGRDAGHASASSPTPMCATRSRRRACRSWTARRAVHSTFRPQEAFSTQALDAAVRALNREQPQAVFITGDLTDNAQRNELDLATRSCEGGEVDPDSGARATTACRPPEPRPVLLPPRPRRPRATRGARRRPAAVHRDQV